MVRRLREVARLPRAERLVLVEAAFLLLVARVALRMMSVTRLVACAACRSAPPSAPGPDRLLALLEAAARHVPHTTCLERALAARWLLARRGIPATIHIGVTRRDGALAAHAWLERRGASIAAEAAAYTSLAMLGDA